MLCKYKRTYHLPWSLGITSDDKMLKDVSCFDGKTVVITEKMDGENTSLYRDYYHARSLDSKHHPSRSYVKQIHAQICRDIPTGWRICGENLYAKHSIGYDNLRSYFYCFSVWDENNLCLSWADTLACCEVLGIEVVPVIRPDMLWDEAVIRAIEVDPILQEGYVVRNADAFHYDDFENNVAKYVRYNHVVTTEHWMHSTIEPNKLINTTT